MISFVTPELATKLKASRDDFDQARDEEIERGQAVSADASLTAAKEVEYEPFSFEEDPGSNNSGYVERNRNPCAYSANGTSVQGTLHGHPSQGRAPLLVSPGTG